MNVLTDEDAKEIHRVLCATVGADYLTIAKAASDFTIKKLAAGVSVEPVDLLQIKHGDSIDARFPARDYFTLDQLNTAIAAARVQSIEECAKAIKDAYMEGFFSMATYNDTQVNDENEEWEKSNAKRSLLGKEQS